MEKILRIEEGSFKHTKGYECSYDGFLIITDKQTIKFGIDMSTSCCENPGYFCSNDELESFIGAELLEIKVVDDCLNSVKLEEEAGDLDWGGAAMFVNLETNKGTLQFTAYNQQNGYYGHTALLISQQLSQDETL